MSRGMGKGKLYLMLQELRASLEIFGEAFLCILDFPNLNEIITMKKY